MQVREKLWSREAFTDAQTNSIKYHDLLMVSCWAECIYSAAASNDLDSTMRPRAMAYLQLCTHTLRAMSATLNFSVT